MGDFNFGCIDYEMYNVDDAEDSPAQNFFDKTQDLFLKPCVTFQTRVRHNNQPSLLDLVFTNEEGMVKEIAELAPLGKSDHVGIKWRFMVESDDITTIGMKLDYWKGDYPSLNHYLEKVNWADELGQLNVDEAWKKFKIVIHNGVHRFEKMKKPTKAKRRRLPGDIRRHINQRNKLWRMYRITARDEDWEKYWKQRNQVTSRIRQWENDNEKERISSLKGNVRKFYSYVRSKQQVKMSVDQVRTDDNQLTDTHLETADVLANFFESVFVSEGDYTEQVGGEILKRLEDVAITEEMVAKKINKIKDNKAQGPDLISPKVLKECRSNVCQPLTLLFQKSLNEEKLPEDWKAANVTPIYKGGDTTAVQNYRPISLTSIPCKLLESIITDQVEDYLKNLGVPNNHQRGFRAGRSCLTNLLTSLEEWTKAVDEGLAVDVIYLDIAKAFDTVPQKRFQHKMRFGWESIGLVVRFLEQQKNESIC